MEKVIITRQFISSFNAWQTISKKAEELEEQRKLLKQQYDALDQLTKEVEKKAQDLKVIAYFFKDLIEDDPPKPTGE